MRHRHAVAGPLLALLLIAVAATVQALPTEHQMKASLIGSARRIDAVSGPQDFTTQNGVVGQLVRGNGMIASTQADFVLVSGEVHLSARGVMTVAVGQDTIYAIGGSVALFRDETTTTVAAIDAPAIVERSDGTWILPLGSELVMDVAGTARRHSIPAGWLSDALRQAGDRLDRSSPPSATEADCDLGTLILGIERMTADRIECALSSVGAESAVLPSLLALRLATESARLEPEAAAIIADTLFDHAQTLDMVMAVPATAAASILPLPIEVIQAWAPASVRRVSTDARGFLADVWPIAMSLPTLTEDAGYPLQAEAWRTALNTVRPVLLSVVPSAETDTVLGSKKPGQVALSPAAPQPVAHFSADELILQTRLLLASSQVLQTATTEVAIDHSGPDRVRVGGVFIAEHGADVPYEFTIDIGAGQVRDIVRAGKPLPNPVPIETFLVRE